MVMNPLTRFLYVQLYRHLPAKNTRVVSKIAKKEIHDGPGGLPAERWCRPDERLVVFAAMGFYSLSTLFRRISFVYAFVWFNYLQPEVAKKIQVIVSIKKRGFRLYQQREVERPVYNKSFIRYRIYHKSGHTVDKPAGKSLLPGQPCKNRPPDGFTIKQLSLPWLLKNKVLSLTINYICVVAARQRHFYPLKTNDCMKKDSSPYHCFIISASALFSQSTAKLQ